MMTILFKGKTLNGKWIYGYPYGTQSGKAYIVPHGNDKRKNFDSIDQYEVIPKTVCQFIGACDGRLKNIYSDDIIELVNEAGETIRVTCEYRMATRTFDNGITCHIPGYCFVTQDGKETFPIVNNYAGTSDWKLFKVVGNIHDND